MARTAVDDENEDTLFRIFEASQGLQQRAFRILARRHFNEHGVMELRTQAEGILRDIAELAGNVNEE